ncbi:hypothetical protein GGP41_006256 [Bipolaris sorokiniana]|uniref:Uncharacterized protein n=1 Tax=Cochliobolus sativus TaxID=45130 RepID=A0A8H5ZHL7_COCSA|nr:hypothetical protein GGP41_006256 [Bipolaris sorokiniana]
MNRKSPHVERCDREQCEQCEPIFLYSEELAERGTKHMEKKNVVFTKDGAKVGVRELNAEKYTDRTQKAFVKTWNAATEKR